MGLKHPKNKKSAFLQAEAGESSHSKRLQGAMTNERSPSAGEDLTMPLGPSVVLTKSAMAMAPTKDACHGQLFKSKLFKQKMELSFIMQGQEQSSTKSRQF